MSNRKNYNKSTPMIQNSSLIKYANDNDVTLAEISEKLGVKDTEFSIMLRSHLGYHKEQEIKAIIDGIVATRNEEGTPESVEELNFISCVQKHPTHYHSSRTCDVFMSCRPERGAQKKMVSFAFKNDGFVIGERCEFAFTRTRVYFKESGNGYKLTPDANNDSIRRCRIPADDKNYEFAHEHTGGYTIKRDEKLGLYYIDTMEHETE